MVRKLFNDPVSAAHPFTLLPLFGQVLLLVTLFQREQVDDEHRDVRCLLLLLMAFTGVTSPNYKIFLSTVPSIVAAIMAVLEARKR